MCDCLLLGVPNRRAVEGEQLVVHRFRTGSLFFNPSERPSARAVWMPAGARSVVEDIPAQLHQTIGVGQIELVTFTRVTAPGGYRDAVRFKNGREVRLQELCEGQCLWVMDLSRRSDARAQGGVGSRPVPSQAFQHQPRRNEQ
jgi:hypothetical protein